MAVCLVVGPIEPATNRGRSGVLRVQLLDGDAGAGDGGGVDLGDQLERQAELLHADRAGAEGVRLDDVGARLQVAAVDLRDVVGAGEAEDVGEVLEVFVVIGEPLAAHGRLVEPQILDLRPHGAVEDQNPFVEERFELVSLVVDGGSRHGGFG